MKRQDDAIPQPIYDSNLTSEDRDEQRAARVKAAEQRMKKAGVSQPKKKNKVDPSEPLRGPNSQNLMRWTASSS